MVLSILVRLLAFALIFEAMFAGLYVANLLGELQIYDAIAIALILARGVLGAVQFAGGWLLANRRPQGFVLAQKSSSEFTDFVRRQAEAWGPVVRATGASL